jgi:AcrR family transcriptional regulator
VSDVTPARRSQSERRAATRGALIAAARELFAEYGFAGVGREEIVERAGVTRGAMYHYFASKEALFTTAYEEVERDLCDAIAVAAMTTDDPVEQVRLGSAAFLRSAVAGEVRRIVFIDGPAVVDPETRREIGERYGLGLIREALTAIQAAGRLATGEAELLAPILMATLHEAAAQIAEGADQQAVTALVNDLLDRITTRPPKRRTRAK